MKNKTLLIAGAFVVALIAWWYYKNQQQKAFYAGVYSAPAVNTATSINNTLLSLFS